MMQMNTLKGITYVTVGDSTYTFQSNLQGIFDCNELLEKITTRELFDLMNSHGGIPMNFKEFIVKKAKLYGDSLEISSFICEGNKAWLDKQQRASITNLLNNSIDKLDLENFELVLHNKVHSLPVIKIKELLNNLDLYSYKCLINTTRHIQNIENLKTLLELLEYDYTTGYPEKINLE